MFRLIQLTTRISSINIAATCRERGVGRCASAVWLSINILGTEGLCIYKKTDKTQEGRGEGGRAWGRGHRGERRRGRGEGRERDGAYEYSMATGEPFWHTTVCEAVSSE